MSEREKIYIFDDGSIESKLLQHELKDKYDIQVVGVNIASDIIECFEKIQPDKKVHLHYTYEKYAADHEKLRRDIQKVEHLGFRNLIVLDYEGLDSVTAYHRAKIAGLKDDIKLTGKPESIAIDLPEQGIDESEKVGIDKPYTSEHPKYYATKREQADEKEYKSKSRFRKKFL